VECDVDELVECDIDELVECDIDELVVCDIDEVVLEWLVVELCGGGMEIEWPLQLSWQ